MFEVRNESALEICSGKDGIFYTLMYDIAQRRWTGGVIAGDSGWRGGPRRTSPKGGSA